MRTFLLAAAFASAAVLGSISCRSSSGGGDDGAEVSCCGAMHTYAYCCPLSCIGGPTAQECSDHGFGETGIDSASGSGGSASLTLGTGPDSSVDESSGGMCVPDTGLYACHGWVAGVYQRSDTGNKSFVFGTDLNAHCVGGEGETILIPLPNQGSDADNELGFSECKSACDELVAGGMYGESYWGPLPAGYSQYAYLRTDCIFAPDGNNGRIPDGQLDADLSGASELCDWVGKSGDIINGIPVQIPYVEPAPDDMCAPMVQCDDWNPQSTSNITHNLVGTTHTTWIDDVFLAELLDTLAAQAYECDVGRFAESIRSGVTSFAMSNLQSNGELLYSLGFRSGDNSFRVKKTGTTTWYTLDSFAHIADAFDALHPLTGGLTFEFHRGSATHTLNLTST